VGTTFESRVDGTLPREACHEARKREKSDAPQLQYTVGMMAYNEEENIANAINAILSQESTSAELDELIVVASGCTDRTTDIVASLAREEPRLRLVVQERRAGKASAINLFIATARSPILLMVNGDNIARPGAIDALVEHFHDPTVGMVGGHPIPVNDDDNFLGYAVHLVWRLHDRIARDTPKLGEIVAFRNIVPRIPTDTAVDEISIQAVVTELGLRLVYEPRAIVYNRGPATLGDFLVQRRRIFAGHLHIARQQGYAASTMSVGRVGRALLHSESSRIARDPLWVVGAVALEMTARALGYYDFLRRRPHHIWTAVVTTKSDVAEGVTHWEQNASGDHVIDLTEGRFEPSARDRRALLPRLARPLTAVLGAQRMYPAAKRMEPSTWALARSQRRRERAPLSFVRGRAAAPIATFDRSGPLVDVARGVVVSPETRIASEEAL
jgi:poly-beta-1,6-N-acetyl-D-glucosamine synthase